MVNRFFITKEHVNFKQNIDLSNVDFKDAENHLVNIILEKHHIIAQGEYQINGAKIVFDCDLKESANIVLIDSNNVINQFYFNYDPKTGTTEPGGDKPDDESNPKSDKCNVRIFVLDAKRKQPINGANVLALNHSKDRFETDKNKVWKFSGFTNDNGFVDFISYEGKLLIGVNVEGYEVLTTDFLVSNKNKINQLQVLLNKENDTSDESPISTKPDADVEVEVKVKDADQLLITGHDFKLLEDSKSKIKDKSEKIKKAELDLTNRNLFEKRENEAKIKILNNTQLYLSDLIHKINTLQNLYDQNSNNFQSYKNEFIQKLTRVVNLTDELYQKSYNFRFVHRRELKDIEIVKKLIHEKIDKLSFITNKLNSYDNLNDSFLKDVQKLIQSYKTDIEAEHVSLEHIEKLYEFVKVIHEKEKHIFNNKTNKKQIKILLKRAIESKNDKLFLKHCSNIVSFIKNILGELSPEYNRILDLEKGFWAYTLHIDNLRKHISKLESDSENMISMLDEYGNSDFKKINTELKIFEKQINVYNNDINKIDELYDDYKKRLLKLKSLSPDRLESELKKFDPQNFIIKIKNRINNQLIPHAKVMDDTFFKLFNLKKSFNKNQNDKFTKLRMSIKRQKTYMDRFNEKSLN
jgi:hypothetical protein